MKPALRVPARALPAPHATMRFPIVSMDSPVQTTPAAPAVNVAKKKIAPMTTANVYSIIVRIVPPPANAPAISARQAVTIIFVAPAPAKTMKPVNTVPADVWMVKTVTTMSTPVPIIVSRHQAMRLVQPAANKVAPPTATFAPTKTVPVLRPMAKSVPAQPPATVAYAVMKMYYAAIRPARAPA